MGVPELDPRAIARLISGATEGEWRRISQLLKVQTRGEAARAVRDDWMAAAAVNEIFDDAEAPDVQRNRRKETKVRTDAELGKVLYSKQAEDLVKDEQEEQEEAPERQPMAQGAEADKKIAEALYGKPWNPRYPKLDAASHRVEDIIRDVDGRIMLRGWADGKVENLVAENASLLAHADLSGMQLPPLPNGDLREADLRGTKLGNLQRADIRGIVVDETTDISEADFAWTKMTTEDFERLKGCRGFDTARNLARPAIQGLK
jgi:hypothetical protein